MKVALYARVSTDDKNQNPETQLKILREFCANAKHEIYQEYIDQARAKDYKHRTAWAKLQTDAKMHRFDCVLVYKLDRAFRSVRETYNVLFDWDERGIKFRSITQDVIDTTTAMGKAMLGIMAVMAELESSLISDRVKAGIARTQAEGNRYGRKPFDIPSQIIYDALHASGNVRDAAKQLSVTYHKSVSIPYMYKILKPLKLSPSKIAKGLC